MVQFIVKHLKSVSEEFCFSIDCPNLDEPVRAARDGNYLRVEGWVVKRNIELVYAVLYSELLFRGPLLISNLSIRHDVSEAFDLAPDTPVGFRFDLNLIGLQGVDRLLLAAVMTDELPAFAENSGLVSGNFTVFAEIELEVKKSLPIRMFPEYPTDICGSPSPLFVTSLGRSGSTALMSCLSASPQVFVSGSYPYESRPLTYLTHVMRLSVSPSPEYSDVGRSGFLDNVFLASTNPFIDEVNYPDLYRQFDRVSEDLVAACLKAAAARLFGSPSDHEKRPARVYWAEKLPPNTTIASVCRLVWPRTEEIVLVREFSSWLNSAITFSSSTGMFFGAELGADSLTVRIRADVFGLIKYVQTHGRSLRIVRYEDLKSDPNCLQQLLLGLGIAHTHSVSAALSNPISGHASDHHNKPDLLCELSTAPAIGEISRLYNNFFGYH